jgi:hypothetical protein
MNKDKIVNLVLEQVPDLPVDIRSLTEQKGFSIQSSIVQKREDVDAIYKTRAFIWKQEGRKDLRGVESTLKNLEKAKVENVLITYFRFPDFFLLVFTNEEADIFLGCIYSSSRRTEAFDTD